MKSDRIVSVNWQRLCRAFQAFLGICWILILAGSIAVIVSNLDKFKGIRVNAQLVLEYINALKYPLLILFFGLFFQRPIRKFLNEADTLDTKLGKMTRKPPAQQQADPSELASKPDADEPANDDIDEDDTEEATRHELLTSPEAIAEFHRIYRIIWGSQLEALKKLNAFRDGLSENDLQEFLAIHKKSLSNSESGFDTVNELMQYPVSEILAKYEPEKNIYHLTYAGLYFLNWLRERELLDRELMF